MMCAAWISMSSLSISHLLATHRDGKKKRKRERERWQPACWANVSSSAILLLFVQTIEKRASHSKRWSPFDRPHANGRVLSTLALVVCGLTFTSPSKRHKHTQLPKKTRHTFTLDITYAPPDAIELQQTILYSDPKIDLQTSKDIFQSINRITQKSRREAQSQHWLNAITNMATHDWRLRLANRWKNKQNNKTWKKKNKKIKKTCIEYNWIVWNP